MRNERRNRDSLTEKKLLLSYRRAIARQIAGAKLNFCNAMSDAMSDPSDSCCNVCTQVPESVAISLRYECILCIEDAKAMSRYCAIGINSFPSSCIVSQKCYCASRLTPAICICLATALRQPSSKNVSVRKSRSCHSSRVVWQK